MSTLAAAAKRVNRTPIIERALQLVIAAHQAEARRHHRLGNAVGAEQAEQRAADTAEALAIHQRASAAARERTIADLRAAGLADVAEAILSDDFAALLVGEQP